MNIQDMTTENKLLLFHCLEWIHFWWENQSENDWEGSEQDQEGCDDWASHWYSMESDQSDDPCNVSYSAGVYSGDICEEDVIQSTMDRYTTEQLNKIIENDYKSFMDMSGVCADGFLPTWF